MCYNILNNYAKEWGFMEIAVGTRVKKKRVLIWFVKAFLAAVVAFGLITLFCFFYCNMPSHYTTPSGTTDYYWDKNALSIRGTEGFAFTKTDDNGYVNTYPSEKETIDILLMGSSHTEGFNVGKTENYAYVLNEFLAENSKDMYAYSIGTSGHTFSRCLRNLESAVKEFAPTKYIVIETSSLEIPFSELQKLDDGTLEVLPSQNSGVSYYLQKSDFLRRVYTQLTNAMENKGGNDKADVAPLENTQTKNSSETPVDDTDWYYVYLEKTLQKAKNIAEKNNCQLIILYNAEIDFDYNGKIEEQRISENGKKLLSLCQKYDIALIDMYPAFTQAYNETLHLPQGFSNTRVGEGHINRYGHEEIAKELYRYIAEDK
jgi:hypothetical protein